MIAELDEFMDMQILLVWSQAVYAVHMCIDVS